MKVIIAATVTTNSENAILRFELTMNHPRIRKLTPREYFRLMGVSEENINKIQNVGISNSQQYKMAGNSIVVDNLYYIFKSLFNDTLDCAR